MLRWSLVISSPIFWHLHSSSSPLLAGFRGRVRFSNGQRRSLVVGLELFDFYCSVQLGISSSQLTNSHIFQRGRLNQQPGVIYIAGWHGGIKSSGEFNHQKAHGDMGNIMLHHKTPIMILVGGLMDRWGFRDLSSI